MHRERQSMTQRTYSLNRHDKEKIREELEMSWLAQGYTVWCQSQRQQSGILISSPAICSFSWPTTICCSNAYRVLMALQIIVYDSVFLTSVSFTCKHAHHWTWSPPGTVPAPSLCRVWRVFKSDYKVTFTAEMRQKQRERRRVQLLWNLAVETPSCLATPSQKLFVLKI